MHSIQIGQRFISDMEPELGLGIVTAADHRTVRIYFRAGNCHRQYALGSASLRRVKFQSGDVVKTRDGIQFTIEKTENQNGLLVYFGNGHEMPEQDLSDILSFTTPKERLLNGIVDSNYLFDLRYETTQRYSALRHSPVHGFMGARIQLIPHQIYVAHEVARRAMPRVMLCDEVGLGKTIEACLILHRLLLTGRISRVLILVPEALVYQWFVELLRKFNLIFRIVDSDYCSAIRRSEPEANVFLKDQLCLCSIQFLVQDESFRQHAACAEWDMLVVDEAHHLTEQSPSYELARQLCSVTPAIMLLTATPEQHGRRSHFARLRLLDPDRYHDYEAFEQEQQHYQKTVKIADRLLDPKPFTDGDMKALNIASAPDRKKLLTDLLDRHGTGRVMFHNTRTDKSGFPQRDVHLIPLEADRDFLVRFAEEFRAEVQGAPDTFVYDYFQDPRVAWLVELLKKLKHEKIVLICCGKSKAAAIDNALRRHMHMRIHTALFHEDLTLLQRDRNAAWFARKDGAPILICSEIGSEGRNFQSAHHLVLFDLPLDPEKLEQRIGRLDRIGQTAKIHIHVPFIRNSPQQTLVRWYHEGLNAFNKNIRGAYDLDQKLGHEIREIAVDNTDCSEFLLKTQHVHRDISRNMEKGRDRLLELHSHDAQTSASLVRSMTQQDHDQGLDQYAARLFDLFGIQTEKVSERTLQLNFDSLNTPAFPVPLLRDETLTATFERNTAIQRDDMEFLTWDHPMLIGAMELLLASEQGNCCTALWPQADADEILLEAIFILECVTEQKLHIDRFLPPTSVRIVVNDRLMDRCQHWFENYPHVRLKNAPSSLLQQTELRALIPRMIAQCQELAEQESAVLIDRGMTDMRRNLENETDRLQSMKKVNPDIRDEEIQFFQQEKTALEKAIASARLRLDAMRLIFKTKTDMPS